MIAKLVDDNEATSKKLVIDGSQTFLKGLNLQWLLIPINDNYKLIGVVIETKLRIL
ncbi:Phage repressor [Dickeya dianthicola RNS04.9]|nr:Phage repressor [Dickeya dianthicola RNS04.9]